MSGEKNIFHAIIEIHIYYLDTLEDLSVSCQSNFEMQVVLLSNPEGVKVSVSCLGYSLCRCLHAQLMTDKVLLKKIIICILCCCFLIFLLSY